MKTLYTGHNQQSPQPIDKADSIDQANTSTIHQDRKYDMPAKAEISKSDSLIHLYSSWAGRGFTIDWRIFGYAKPDTTSKRMILISIFTDDVEGNPFQCPFGAYYDTSKMKNESHLQLKYLSKAGKFIKAAIIKKHEQKAVVYIRKRWVRFETDNH